MNKMEIKIQDTAKDFFRNHPNQEIPVSVATEAIKNEHLSATGIKILDVGRTIRYLYEDGFVERTDKGVYKYDPKTSLSKGVKRKKQTVVFSKKTINRCLANAKAKGDENAEKCFKKILCALYKHGIKEYTI